MVTNEAVDRALTLIAEGGGNYEYFFSKLNSPDWIKPLHERGRFSHPPEAVSDGQYLRFPAWPEGEYLSRMAAIAPDAVYSALPKSCFQSNNHIVHRTLLEIAAKLPVPLAAQVARGEAEWVSGQTKLFFLYPDRAAELITRLARGGEGEAALHLLGSILDVRPRANQREDHMLADGQTFRLSVDPVGRLDAWHIERLMYAVCDSLVASSPVELLSLLSRMLAKAILIHDNDRGNEEDFSWIWRPQIAHGNHRDIPDVLVTSVQRCAQLVVRSYPDGHEIARRAFREQRWPIFKRLEAYVLLEAERIPVEVVEQLLVDPSNYENPTENPEFNELLGRWIGKVTEQTRCNIWTLIDSGPDLSGHSSYLSEQDTKGTKADAERALRNEWRLRWLSVLAADLDESRTAELNALRTEYGAPRPPYRTSGFYQAGHVSEITEDALRKLTMPELISYLRSWVPPPTNHPAAPSRAGIGQLLTHWVTESPSLFSEHLSLFHDLKLHPTYLRSVLDGFTSALNGKEDFDVLAVVRTIAWLLADTRADAQEQFKWEENPGWSWAYMSSARFLTELFLHPERISVERHEEFWPALALIAQTQSPTADDEREYRKTRHFGSMALNSTRPTGLEAVMRYARWLKLSKSNINVDAKSLPKVFALLSKHLDPAIDDSVAVREMFGMQFGLLSWLDPVWLKEQLPALFPGKPHRDLDKFAWNSYLRFGNPIAELLPAMRFRYERAINALDGTTTEIDDSDRALGNHLTAFLAAEVVPLDDPLLEQFFSKASPALRAQTIGDIGWRFTQEAGDPSIAVQKRLMAFWEARFAAGLHDPASARHELGAFGWWISSGKFPDDWSVHQAVAVADTFRDLHPDFAVVERFAQLAAKYPYEAVRCLGIVFEEDREGWAIHGWGDNASVIIREALKAGEKSKEEAIRVVNLFVSRGHREYRAMFPS